MTATDSQQHSPWTPRRWLVLAILLVLLAYVAIELLMAWVGNLSNSYLTALQPATTPVFFIVEGALFCAFIVLGLWDWIATSGEWYRKQTVFPLPNGNSIADEEAGIPPQPGSEEIELPELEP
jgi:phosphotransferase system  glucose/maltose/N-acetylglucosamine-specific IIC component